LFFFQCGKKSPHHSHKTEKISHSILNQLKLGRMFNLIVNAFLFRPAPHLKRTETWFRENPATNLKNSCTNPFYAKPPAGPGCLLPSNQLSNKTLPTPHFRPTPC
jgi:hypothetical protein